ncbi:MAG: hypothetical protein ABIR96_03905 [Bdellovibrionota bacterium]
MTKNIFATMAAFVFLGSVTANAANLRQDRQLIQDAIDAAQRGRGPYNDGLRRAEDNLSAVQRDIYDIRPTRDKDALCRSLDDALRALRDYRLPDYQKIDYVVRSANDALRSIDLLDRGTNSNAARFELDQALGQLDRISYLMRDRRFREAQDQVVSVQSVLNRYRGDRDLDDASRELDRVNQILGDRYLDPRRATDEMDRSARIVRELVMRSRIYRDDANVPGDRDDLATTRNFGRIFATTEMLNIGIYEGRFVGLVFIGLGADIRIDSIEVVYGNGRSEIFYGGYIRDNERLRLDLRGYDRLIRSIRVTAQSMGGGRRSGDGALQIRGIR